MNFFLVAGILLISGLAGATDKSLRRSSDARIQSDLFHPFDSSVELEGYGANSELANHLVESTAADTVKYSLTFFYSDGACTAMTTATALKLDQCYKLSGNYTKTTVSTLRTTVTTTRTKYRDSACTEVLGKPVSKSVQSACSSGEGGYRQAAIGTTFSFPSAAAGILINHHVDASCKSAPVRIAYFQTGLCINGTTESVSGSTITTNKYSNPTCSGASVGDTYVVGACVQSLDADGSYVTATPVPASLFPSIGAASPSSCFAGSETVDLDSREVRAISDVRVGDRILAANSEGKTSFSEVIFIPHEKNQERAVFKHITTRSGRDIKTTLNHVLPAGLCKESSSSLPLIQARYVRVGDCILTVAGLEMVSDVTEVVGEGVYTVVTMEEYVVVNGVIASPFGSNHFAANLYYNIHRFLHTVGFSRILNSHEVASANEMLGKMVYFAGWSS